MRFNRRYFLRTTTATATACVAGQDLLAAAGKLVSDAPITFNVGIYQDGTMAEASVEQFYRLNRALRS